MLTVIIEVWFNMQFNKTVVSFSDGKSIESGNKSPAQVRLLNVTCVALQKSFLLPRRETILNLNLFAPMIQITGFVVGRFSDDNILKLWLTWLLYNGDGG